MFTERKKVMDCEDWNRRYRAAELFRTAVTRNYLGVPSHRPTWMPTANVLRRRAQRNQPETVSGTSWACSKKFLEDLPCPMRF